jgi:Zn-dependent protease with chaperone function
LTQKAISAASQRVEVEPDWLSYLRLLNAIAPCIWLGWLGLGLWAGQTDLLPGLLPSLLPRLLSDLPPGLLREGLGVSLFVLPPVGAIAGCYAISYRLFVRVGSVIWTKSDLVQQVVWGQLRNFLPLALFFSGCRLFFFDQLALAVLLWAAAYLSQTLLNQLVAQVNDLSSQALTTGELHDQICARAEQAGVALKQIYVMPSGRSQMANAFALQDGNVILTEPLLRHLNCPEVDAVIAHELAHLQYHHPQKLQFILLTAVIGNLLSHLMLTSWLPGLPIIPVGLLLLPVYYGCSRQFEYAADRQAASLSNPTAMITGLVKLAQLTGTPLNWGKRGWMMTHPSMRQRIEAIGQCYGVPITPQMLSRSPSDAVPRSQHYQICSSSLVFSSGLKQRSRQRLLWIWMLALLLPPLLLISCRPQPALSQISWQIAAGLTALAGAQLAANRLPLWGYASLRQQLSQKLSRQLSFDPTACQAAFVGLAPHPTPRYYEGMPHWDLGFLYLQGQHLCYVGEQTQFSLDVTQIKLSLEPAPQSAIVIRSAAGVLRLQACEAQSLGQMRSATARLKQRIQRWQQAASLDKSAMGAQLASMPPPIPAPKIGQVTSQSVQEHRRSQIVEASTKLTAMLLGLSLMLQLPWSWQPGSALYLLLIAVTGALLRFLP